MHNEHSHLSNINLNELVLLLLFVSLMISYLFSAVFSSKNYKQWPIVRSILWVLGIICVASAFVGPVPNGAHGNFPHHMIGHLLLGMLAPLLLVLSAPITLLFRTLSVKQGRRLTVLLKSRPIHFISDPIVASILNVGCLWILYMTSLYHLMHENIFFYMFIHIHIFIAGYNYTASMIYIDPTPHRRNYLYRAIVLILSSAGHSILSKYIFIYPPAGVPKVQAEIGGIMMYYGGDVIDIFLIFLFCMQWYKANKPSNSLKKELSS